MEKSCREVPDWMAVLQKNNLVLPYILHKLYKIQRIVFLYSGLLLPWF